MKTVVSWQEAVAAPLLGGLALMASNTIAIPIISPWPSSGLWVRLGHHFFDAAQTAGLSVLVALVFFLWVTYVTRRA